MSFKKFENYWNKKIKRIDLWDLSIVKSTSMLFGIIIGAYASSFVLQNICALSIAFAVGVSYLIWKVYFCKD